MRQLPCIVFEELQQYFSCTENVVGRNSVPTIQYGSAVVEAKK